MNLQLEVWEMKLQIWTFILEFLQMRTHITDMKNFHADLNLKK